jgi:formylglycine-generating enzyme required for sulfatase activity
MRAVIASFDPIADIRASVSLAKREGFGCRKPASGSANGGTMMRPKLNWTLLPVIGLAALQSCGPANRDATGGSDTKIAEASKATPKLIKDCTDANTCPDMVSLPGDTFVMGSPKSEPGRFDDEDQHQVKIAAFAIAKSPVTKVQWAAFVTDTGRPTPEAACAYAPAAKPSWKDTGFPQTDNDPVVCVTWKDAQDYSSWLSKRTGQHYRLPTDEEWEYAARAGTSTAFPWGPMASHAFANYGMDECCGPAVKGPDKWEFTSPVGSFPPNAFGLVDMHGNVFQWVETCADTFEKLPLRKDGKGCTYRYARGGVYADRPAVMRSAAKNLAPPPDDKMTIDNYRSAGFGFRVARDLR